VLVDDEPEMLELLRLRFERYGGFAVVGQGGDGPDAVALCATHRPDVLVLDALMPSGHGTEVVPEVLETSPETVVIIYTADSGTGTRDAAERVGAHAVVGKLDPFERLVATIFRLLPDHAPPAEEADDFGDRMAALLEADGAGGDRRSWWRSPGRTRAALVLVLLLVVLPLAAAAVWAASLLVGGGSITR
jgi:two-component system LytT family response regulator